MLSIIVAIAENNAIGKDNNLLWRLPNDLKRFKEITMTGSSTMIMGRKNFESLPKVLPGRKHIVITHNRDFSVEDKNVSVIHDLEVIKPYLESSDEYFVIGGGEIYKLLLPYTDKMYITEVHKSFAADTFFPEFDKDDWEVVYRSPEITDEKSGLKYTHVDYVRKNK